MISLRIRRKLRDDLALNVSELALVTGYNRGTLTGMMLPLQSGKMFYTDFRRILHARQDAREASRVVSPGTAESIPANSHSKHAEALFEKNWAGKQADKFRCPRPDVTRHSKAHVSSRDIVLA